MQFSLRRESVFRYRRYAMRYPSDGNEISFSSLQPRSKRARRVTGRVYTTVCAFSVAAARAKSLDWNGKRAARARGLQHDQVVLIRALGLVPIGERAQHAIVVRG